MRKCKANERLIFTADCFVEQVHFSRKYMTFEEIGYKAMVANISDCAAMGAVPDHALVQMVFPKSHPALYGEIRKIYKGFNDACKKWGFPIVGGNLSHGPCWMIAITLAGRLEKGHRPLMRTGIRHGDILWTSGVPGCAAAGRAALEKWKRPAVPRYCRGLVQKHVRPQARIDIGRMLSADRLVHAAIDISDGISKDCATLCYENDRGTVLDISEKSISSAMLRLAKEIHIDWTQWFFNGGEDYELLFAASPRFDPLYIERATGISFLRLGRFDKNIKGMFLKRNSHLVPINAHGWDHI